MYSRTSIYDRLQRKAIPSPKNDKPRLKPFDTQSMAIWDAWLMGGFGSIDDLTLDEMAPSACDYTFDSRLRDASGHFIGVARIDVGQEPELGLADRAYQLLNYALPDLLVREDKDDSQIVLQVPTGVDSDEWLDTALALWPVNRQPRHGITVTSSSFDRWLQEVVSHPESPIEHYQFIAVAPLVSRSVKSGHPKGEAAACLWLQRTSIDEPEALSSSLALPTRQEHTSRSLASRRDAGALENTVATSLGDDCDRADVGAIVWDGQVEGNYLDHLTTFLQNDFAHMYMDTDVWSLQGLCGSISADPSAYLTAMAFKLAKVRSQHVLILDSHCDSETLALLLRHSDTTAT